MYLLVKAAGKYWRQDYTHADKRKTLAIGTYPEVSLPKVQRQQQREAIQRWKPWNRSTAPQSREGKASASRNAFTDGKLVKLREMIKVINQALRQQRDNLAKYGLV
jgi:hypothetical protein